MMALKSARRRVGKSGSAADDGSGDNERKPDAGLSARGGKQRCVGVETVAEEELAQRMAGID